MNILMWILIFIGGATGALSTLYLVVSLFAVIFYKTAVYNFLKK